MRLTTFLLLLLLLSFTSFAQTKRISFFNKNWEPTDKDSAAYFRNCIINAEGTHYIGPVSDHYRNGKLKMTGKYNSNGVKTGEFIFYFPNGQTELKSFFNNNVQDSIWEYWYTSKQKKQEIFFKEGKPIIQNYWNEAGEQLVKNGEGIFTENSRGPFNNFYKITGKVKKGEKDGVWTCHVSSSKSGISIPYYTEIFQAGRFIEGTIHGGESGYLKVKKETLNKIMPPYQLAALEQLLQNEETLSFEFINTEPKLSVKDIKNTTEVEAINAYLKYHLKLPKKAFKHNLKIDAWVNENGTLGEFSFPEPIDEQVKENIIAVLNRIVDLEPLIENGKPVKRRIKIPLKIE